MKKKKKLDSIDYNVASNYSYIKVSLRDQFSLTSRNLKATYSSKRCCETETSLHLYVTLSSCDYWHSLKESESFQIPQIERHT